MVSKSRLISRTLLLIVFVSFLLLSSCRSFKDISFGEIQGVELNSFAGNIAHLSLFVPVENPRGIGFRIQQMDLKLYYEGDYLGHVTNAEKIKIPRKSTDLYEIKLKVELPGIFGAMRALKFLKNPGGTIKLAGEVKVKYLLLLGKTIEIKETHTLDKKQQIPEQKPQI